MTRSEQRKIEVALSRTVEECGIGALQGVIVIGEDSHNDTFSVAGMRIRYKVAPVKGYMLAGYEDESVQKEFAIAMGE